MIVVSSRDPERFRTANRGLLGWLHSDGVLVIPAELVSRPVGPEYGEGRDWLAEALEAALLAPVEDQP